jgi:hypothetical protein
MSGLEKSPTPEERLRLLLAEAVEPVQPGPGAEARLRAKIHAGRRERDLPRRLRWAGAALGAAVVLAGGVLVVTQTGRTDGTSDSFSATSAGAPAAAGPSSPAAGSSGALSYGHQAPRPAAAASAPTADLGGTTSDQQKGAGSVAGTPQVSEGKSGVEAAPLNPQGAALTPFDLDGDRSSDRLMISGQRLVVAFRSGTQSVTLPQVSVGARVLGVTQLRNASGAWTPVAFIRLGADSAHARDTLVAVVAGKLTVLRLAGKPVVLAVTATQGYTCAGLLLVAAGEQAAYTVDGADLIPAGLGGGVAKPGSNCSFS